MAEDVLVERDGGLLVITLNRPRVRNAMNAAMSARIAAALDELDADEDLSVGILTGAGGTFCAGMDLKAFLNGERPEVADRGFGGLTQAPPAKR
jgi:enoyl-CoA hydratase/carnithine racemase